MPVCCLHVCVSIACQKSARELCLWSEWLHWSMEEKIITSGCSVPSLEMLPDKDVTFVTADELRSGHHRHCDSVLWRTVYTGELAHTGQSLEPTRSRHHMNEHLIVMPDALQRHHNTDGDTSFINSLINSAQVKQDAPNDLSLPESNNHRDGNLVCSSERDHPLTSDKSQIRDMNKLSSYEEAQRAKVFQCKTCPQAFSTKNNLQNHIRCHEKHGEGFYCSRCALLFFDQRKWEKHDKLHQHFDSHRRPDAESVYTCSRCGHTYDCPFMLERHEYNHIKSDKRKSRVFRCSHCPRTFTTDALLREHFERSHSDGASMEYVCQLCSKPFLHQAILYNHMERLHSREELSKIGPVHGCSKCSQVFVEADRLRIHEFQMHHDSVTDNVEVNGSHLQCSVCRKSFEDPSSLKKHRLTHGRSSGESVQRKLEKPAVEYVCNHCGRVCKSLRNLNCHVLTHTGVRPLVCRVPGCTKRFTQHGTRRFHERTHSDDMPHICPICGRRFKHATTVKLHMSVHTGAKPHQCPSCPMKFRRSCDLTRHSLMHSDRRLFLCSRCEKSFKTKKTLSRHILALHSDEIPFRCCVCDKGFKQAGNLRVHMRVHTGDQPYVCAVCGVRFAYPGSLKSHMQAHSARD